MDLLERAKGEREYMVGLRRQFHMHPERSWEEHWSRDTICRELDAMGVPWQVVAGTGVIGTLNPGGGKVVALRADMDALPVQEEGDKPYASRQPGVMHACGHDGHMAALLGAARILAGTELPGEVRLVFQPAEEVMGGAKAMAELPQLAGVDTIGGVHIWSTLPVGTINVQAGPRMARADLFEVEITGSGSHGSMPHLGVDAAFVAGMVSTAAQAVVSRRTDPLEPAVVSFGRIRSGDAPNVLAGRAEMAGTLRSMNDDTGDWLIRCLDQVVEHIPAAFGAVGEMRITQGVPAVINDSRCAEIARACALDLVGESGLAPMAPTTGGEDFAYYLRRIPGVFAFVGGGNPDKDCGYPHHHCRFDFDEEALVLSAAFLASYAVRA